MPRSTSKPAKLRSKKQRHVLLVQSWWEDRVLGGVACYAAEHDWVLDCRMRWTRQLPDSAWKGDGIIAYTGAVHPQQSLLHYIKTAEVPVVETQIPTHVSGSGVVVIPHHSIGQMAAEHLLSLDFQEIGFVTFADNVIEDERRLGVEQKVKAAGARFHPLRMRDLARQLPRLPKPLGLIAANDVNALSVILTCTQAGFCVPEQIAVIGVDDTEILCDLAAVPLTSVNCNFERQGYEAAALLDRLMDGQPAPPEPIIVQPRGITVRRSTDTVALPDADSARFLRYLRDHFRKLLSLEETARELHISMRRVQDNFRLHLGRTVVQELTRLRVGHAKKLLQDRHLKVEVVALESGFGNRFHFNKTFLRVTGQTPKQYRLALISEE